MTKPNSQLEQLRKMANGYYVEETKVTATKNGQPKAIKIKKFIPPDAKAILALAELDSKGEKPINNTKVRFAEDGRLLVSSAMVAELYGVSDRAVAKWGSKGAPKAKRGWWDLKALIAWRGEAVDVGGAEPSAAQTKLEADTRLKETRAKVEEMKLRELTGELIPVQLVESRVTEIFANVQKSIMAIGDHLMAQIFTLYPELSLNAKRLIKNECQEALKEMSQDGLYRPAPAKRMGRKTRRRT